MNINGLTSKVKFSTKATMILLSVVLMTCLSVSRSARILYVFSIPSNSHLAVHQSISAHLSLRGHQVTTLTPNSIKNPNLINLTEFEFPTLREITAKYHDRTLGMSKDNFLFSTLLYGTKYYGELVEEVLNRSQTIFQNASISFDLVIVENLHPLIYSFGCRFKVPIIGVSSLALPFFAQDAVGNPSHPEILLEPRMQLTKNVGLYKKFVLLFYKIWMRLFASLYALPQYDKKTKKYFGNDCPYIGDILKNVSLVLTSANPVVHPVRPNVPAIVEMQQIHTRPTKPLPHVSYTKCHSSITNFLFKGSTDVFR
jgi:glucuronosyltransferase